MERDVPGGSWMGGGEPHSVPWGLHLDAGSDFKRLLQRAATGMRAHTWGSRATEGHIRREDQGRVGSAWFPPGEGWTAALEETFIGASVAVGSGCHDECH